VTPKKKWQMWNIVELPNPNMAATLIIHCGSVHHILHVGQPGVQNPRVSPALKVMFPRVVLPKVWFTGSHCHVFVNPFNHEE